MTSSEVMVTEAKAVTDHHASLAPLARLKEASRLAPGAINALSSLHIDDWAVTVVAEVKCSTATLADLSDVGGPGILAYFYAAGGAACVSVVTGSSATRGSLRDPDAIRALVNFPILVNDLMITPCQVHEARAHGADLLMLDAHLETLALGGFIERVRFPGMGAAVEVRTRREVPTVVDAGACIVAVDTRDPNTLTVDYSLFDQITDILPMQVTRIAAGGVRSSHDVTSFTHCGVDVVLIGEAIIRSTDP